MVFCFKNKNRTITSKCQGSEGIRKWPGQDPSLSNLRSGWRERNTHGLGDLEPQPSKAAAGAPSHLGTPRFICSTPLLPREARNLVLGRGMVSLGKKGHTVLILSVCPGLEQTLGTSAYTTQAPPDVWRWWGPFLDTSVPSPQVPALPPQSCSCLLSFRILFPRTQAAPNSHVPEHCAPVTPSPTTQTQAPPVPGAVHWRDLGGATSSNNVPSCLSLPNLSEGPEGCSDLWQPCTTFGDRSLLLLHSPSPRGDFSTWLVLLPVPSLWGSFTAASPFSHLSGLCTPHSVVMLAGATPTPQTLKLFPREGPAGSATAARGQPQTTREALGLPAEFAESCSFRMATSPRVHNFRRTPTSCCAAASQAFLVLPPRVLARPRLSRPLPSPHQRPCPLFSHGGFHKALEKDDDGVTPSSELGFGCPCLVVGQFHTHARAPCDGDSSYKRPSHGRSPAPSLLSLHVPFFHPLRIISPQDFV